MRVNPILWLVPVFSVCLVLGLRSSDAIAAEEIKAPLLTGITWIHMSPDQKVGYIWGTGDVIDLEQEIMEIYPELKRESFVTKAVEGIGDVQINEIIATVDSFYKAHPDCLRFWLPFPVPTCPVAKKGHWPEAALARWAAPPLRPLPAAMRR
jgi:hypothetical protein